MFKKVINKFIGKDLTMAMETSEYSDDTKPNDVTLKLLARISDFIYSFYKADNKSTVPYLLIENSVNQILYQKEENKLGTKLRQTLEILYRELLHDLANMDPQNRLQPFNDFTIKHKNFIELGSQIFAVYEQNVLCFQLFNTFAKLCNGILQSELKRQGTYLEYLLNDLIMFITKAGEAHNTQDLLFSTDIVNLILNCGLQDIFLNMYCRYSIVHWQSYLTIKTVDTFEAFLLSIENVIENERMVFETLKLVKYFSFLKTTILKEYFDRNSKDLLLAFDAALDQERYDLANKIIQLMIEIGNIEYISKYFKESRNSAFIKMESLNEVISGLEEINNLSKALIFDKNVFSELKILLHNTLNTEKEISPVSFAEAVDSKLRSDGNWENMIGYWELMRLLSLKNEIFDELYKGFFNRILNSVSVSTDVDIFLHFVSEYGEESLKKFKVLLMDIYKSFKFNRGDFAHWADEHIEDTQKTQIGNDGIYEANFLARVVLEEYKRSGDEPELPFKYFVLILDRMCWPYDELIDQSLNFDALKESFRSLIDQSKEQFKECNQLADLNFHSLYNECEVNYNGTNGSEVTLKLSIIQANILFAFNHTKKWDIKNLSYYLKIEEPVVLRNIQSMNIISEIFHYDNGVLILNEHTLVSNKKYVDFTKIAKKDSFDDAKIKSIMFTEQNKEETLNSKSKALKAFIVKIIKTNSEIHQKDLLNEVSKYLGIKVDYHDIAPTIDNLIESTILKRSDGDVDKLAYTA